MKTLSVRVIALFLSLLMVISSAPLAVFAEEFANAEHSHDHEAEDHAEQATKVGDIDGNGSINAKDTIMLFRYVAGWDVDADEEVMDVNGDGIVNARDSILLFRYVAGWDVEIGPDPDEPVTDPDEPVTDPDEPVTDPDEPVTDPDEPVTDPDEPVTDPNEPVTDPNEPVTDPDEPVTDPDEPVTDPDEPETDPDEPETDPVDPPHEHEPVVDKAVEATCTTDGLTEGSHCRTCGEILVAQTVVGKLGHDTYVLESHTPSCETDGYVLEHCNRCGKTIMKGYTPATGHLYGELETIVELSCATDGHYQQVCVKCGDIYRIDELANGHKFEAGISDENGFILYSCINCGFEKKEKQIQDTNEQNVTLQNVPTNFEFTVQGVATEEEVRALLYIVNTAYRDSDDELLRAQQYAEYQLISLGNDKWAVRTSQPYEKGEHYEITLSNGLSFTDYPGTVLTLWIYEEQKETVDYRDDMIFIVLPEAGSLLDGEIWYWVSEEGDYLYVELPIRGRFTDDLIGAPVCVGEYRSIDELMEDPGRICNFGKLSDIREYDNGRIQLVLIEPDLNEIFDELDVHYSGKVEIQEDDIPEGYDTYIMRQLYRSEGLAEFVASAAIASRQYASDRGLYAAGVEDYSFVDDLKFDFRLPQITAYDGGLRVTVYGALRIPLMNKKGEVVSKLDFIITAETVTNYSYDVNYEDRFWDYDKLDAYITVDNSFAFSFEVRVTNEKMPDAPELGVDEDAFYMTTFGRIHRADCRKLDSYKLPTLRKMTVDELEEYFRETRGECVAKECSICNPISRHMRTRMFVLNEDSKTVHCFDSKCADHLDATNVTLTDQIDQYSVAGYKYCPECRPDKLEEWIIENYMLNSLKQEDWGDVMKKAWNVIKNHGASPDVESSIPIVSVPIPLVFVELMLNISLEFDLKFEASVSFEYKAHNVSTFGARRTGRFTMELEKETTQGTSASQLFITGKIKASVGVRAEVTVSLIGCSWFAALGLYADMGFTATISGVLSIGTVYEYDENGEKTDTVAFGGLYYEVGFYLEVGLVIKILGIPIDLDFRLEVPLFSLGVQKVYYHADAGEEWASREFNRKVENRYVYLAELIRELTVRCYDVKALTDGSEVLSLFPAEGSGYTVQVTLKDVNGNDHPYANYQNGVINISENAPCDFDIFVNFHFESDIKIESFLDLLRYPFARDKASFQMDDYVFILNVKGHRSKTIKAVAPTCTEGGNTYGEYCPNCGEVFTESKPLPPLGHDYLDPYTCHDRPCQRANCVYVDLASTPHRYSNSMTVTMPGHENQTAEIQLCMDCKYIHSEQELVFSHTWSVESLKQPTCSEKGEAILTCLDEGCGLRINYVLDKVDHRYFREEVTDNALYLTATCLEPAYYYYTCSYCDEVEKDPAHIFDHGAPLDHDWNTEKWSVDSKKGVHYHACKRKDCSERSMEELHTGGTATCTSSGTCTVCAAAYIDSLNHDYQYTDDPATGKHRVTCSRCTLDVMKDHVLKDQTHDTDNHWQECNLCGGLVNFVAHDMEPQYNDDEHWTACTGCEYETAHVSHTEKDEYDEKYHWIACEDCDVKKDVSKHSMEYDVQDETHRHYCRNCAYSKESVEHTWKQKHNLIEHWECCEDCLFETERIKHTFDQEITSVRYRKNQASCDEAATYYYSCACGYHSTANRTFTVGEALGHEWANGWTLDPEKGTHYHKCTRTDPNTGLPCATRDAEAKHVYDQKNTAEEYRKSLATCTEAATYYYSCVCGHYKTTNDTFKDGDALNHTWADTWTTDPEKGTHYHKCTRTDPNTGLPCDARDAEGKHVYDQKNTAVKYQSSKATCTEAATYYYSCACGHYTIANNTFPDGDALGHDWNPTWSDDGTEHFRLCLNEGCTEKTDQNTHSGGEFVCGEKRICEVCAKEYGNVVEHDYDGAAWYLDPVADPNNAYHFRDCQRENCTNTYKALHSGGTETCQHGKVCDVCSVEYTAKKEGHDLIKVPDLPSDDEYHYTRCSYEGCGYVFSEKHTFTVDFTRLAQNATCTGNETYYLTCSCGHHDPDGNTEEKPNTKLGHVYAVVHDSEQLLHYRQCTREDCDGLELDDQKQSYTVLPATCTEGARCSVCLYRFTPENGHSYVGKLYVNVTDKTHQRVCDVCGELDKKTAHVHNEKSGMLAEEAKCGKKATYYYGCLCGHLSATSTYQDGEPGKHVTVNGQWENETVVDAAGNKTYRHYQICDLCGLNYNKAIHTYDRMVATNAYKYKDATCTQGTVYFMSCVCGKSSTNTTETFTYGPANGHKYKTDLSHNDEGHYYECEVCGVMDEESFRLHDNKKATCTESTICSICGWIDEATGHDFTSGAYYPDEASGKHFRFCVNTGCTEKSPLISHSYDQNVQSEEYLAFAATCDTNDKYYYSCVCGKADPSYRTFEIADTSLGHVWGTYWTYSDDDNHAKNCTREGCEAKKTEAHQNTELSCEQNEACKVCLHVFEYAPGHEFSDELSYSSSEHYYCCTNVFNGKTCSEKSAVDEHIMTGYRVTVKPTCAAKGTEVNSCSVCAYQTSRSIEKVRHSYDYSVTYMSEGVVDEETSTDEVTYYVYVIYVRCGNYDQCGATKEIARTTAKSDAKPEPEYIEPGCVTEGYIHFYEDGNATPVLTVVIDALGHDWNDRACCKRCGEFAYSFSEGLEFSSNGDGTCAVVGIGTCTDTVVHIPPVSPDGDIVVRIEDRAFCNSDHLTGITIPDTVTSVGYDAVNCPNVIQIVDGIHYVDNWVIGSEYIEEIVEIILRDGTVGIADMAFWGGQVRLSRITFPASLKYIGMDAFSEQWSMETVDIPDDSQLEIIGYGAFSYCGIYGIDLPSSVTKIMHYAFNQSLLGGITIPDNSALTFIGNSAFHTTSLSSITIPAGVTYIGDEAFYASGLSDISIAEGSNLTYIGESAFAWSGLGSISLPESVTTIGDYAFSGTWITELHIPKNVSQIGWGIVGGCSSLRTLTVDVNNSVYHSVDNSLIRTADKTLLGTNSDYIIPGNGIVTSIGDSAFENCENLSSIKIPNGIASIGAYAFDGCYSLTDVYYDGTEEDWDKITIGTNNDPLLNATIHFKEPEIQYSQGLAFTSNGDGTCYVAGIGTCTDTQLVIPSVSPTGDAVTGIGCYAFAYCDFLESVTIPEGVTIIGMSAFERCGSLMQITLPESLTYVDDWVFYKSENLSDVYYGGLKGEWQFVYVGEYNTALNSAVIHASEPAPGEHEFVITPNHLAQQINGSNLVNGVTYAKYDSFIRLMSLDGNGDPWVYVMDPGSDMTLPRYMAISYRTNSELGGEMFIGSGRGPTGQGDRCELGWNGNNMWNYLIVDLENSSLTAIRDGLINYFRLDIFAGYAEGIYLDIEFIAFFASVAEAENYYEDAHRSVNTDSPSDTTVPDDTDAPVQTEGYYNVPIDQWTVSGHQPRIITNDDASLGAVVQAAGVDRAALLHQGSVGIGVMDLSKYDRVIVYCGTDASTQTQNAYNANEHNRILLLNSDMNLQMSPDESTIIASQTYYLHGWAVEAVVIDLTGIDYVGEVYVTYDTLPGLFMVISAIEFSSGDYGELPEVPENIYSQDLQYTSRGDGTCYVSGVTGWADTEIRIPPVSPAGDKVTGIGNNAFSYCHELTTIIIPEGVETIGKSAFVYCNNLTEIMIPASVKTIGRFAFESSGLNRVTFAEGSSLISIGEGAFGYCSNLSSVTIPATVQKIGKTAFQNCTQLVTMAVEAGNTAYHMEGNCLIHTASKTLVKGLGGCVIPDDGSVMVIGDYAFNNCTGLTEIIIPEGVTVIGDWAFANCWNLTHVTIPKTVACIGDCAFIWCQNLSTMTIPADSPMTSIGREAFAGTGLTQFVIPEGITELPMGVFFNCYSLSYVTIPSGVTSIGAETFANCSSLTEIILPEGLTSIEYNTFSGCSSLTSVIIPENVTRIDAQAFEGCINLLRVNIPASVTSIGDAAFRNCTNLVEAQIPEDSCLTCIGTEAFAYCNSLQTIKIPYGVAAVLDNVFIDCSSLHTVELSEGLKSIGNNAFAHCIALSEVVIPLSVTTVGACAFTGCHSLTTVVIPENSQWQRIEGHTFSGCISLKEIVFPASATFIDQWAFLECYSLTDITVAEGNPVYHSANNCLIETASRTLMLGCQTSVIPDDGSVAVIGAYAFYRCIGLTEITIPEGVTNIGDHAFFHCDSLTSVTIPCSVTSICDWAFAGCYNLSAVTIPEDSELTYIGTDAFLDCSGLTSIVIPKGVNTISEAAFLRCNALSDVYFIGTEDEWSMIRINGNNDPLLNANIHFRYSEGLEFSSNGDGTCYVSGIGTCTDTYILIPPTSPAGDTVTGIGLGAFANVSFVTRVSLHKGVKVIGRGAFACCTSLTDVTYSGYESDWKAIEIGADNEPLLNATIHWKPILMWNEKMDVVLYRSFDILYADTDAWAFFTPGSSDSWSRIADVAGLDITTLTYWGWVALKDTSVGQFGYRIDQGETVFNDGFTAAPEQGVIDASVGMGGGTGTRMQIVISLAGLPCGEHTVQVLYRSLDGEAVRLDEFTVVIPEGGIPDEPLPTHTVTWIVDGKTFTSTVEEGYIPVFNGSTDKPSDERYLYSFIGWDKTLVGIYEDTTYTAVYERIMVSLPKKAGTYVLAELSGGLFGVNVAFGQRYDIGDRCLQAVTVRKVATLGDGGINSWSFKVWQWNTDYATTVAAEPLFVKLGENHPDNGDFTVWIEGVEIKGEFYYEIEYLSGSGAFATWAGTDQVSGLTSYENGVLKDVNYASSVTVSAMAPANGFESNVYLNSEGTRLMDSDLAEYFTIQDAVFGSFVGINGQDKFYDLGSISELYADVSSKYFFKVNMLSCGTGYWMFVRGYRVVNSDELIEKFDPTYGVYKINNYYETDGNGHCGGAGIYAQIRDGMLNIVIKYYDPNIVSRVGNKYYAIPVQGTELTITDDGSTVSFVVDGVTYATVVLSGSVLYNDINDVSPRNGFAQQAVITMKDGTTDTITNTLIADGTTSQIGLVVRGGPAQFDYLAVGSYDRIIVPDLEIEEPKPTTYTVTWIVDGQAFTETVEEGTVPSFSGSTDKAADENYTYTFTGWDKEIVAVTEDVTYTAVYEQTKIVKFYTVTWIVDGQAFTETVEEGTVPSFSGSTDKAADENYTYTFTGWDKEIVAVVEDVTYTAMYEKTAIVKPEQDENSITIDFSDIANRTEYKTTIQVWANGDFVLTNNKTSNSPDIGNYCNPARFYAHTEMIFSGVTMTKLIFNCNQEKYVTALTDTLNGLADITVTTEGLIVTVEFAAPVETFVIKELSAQVRLDSVTVRLATVDNEESETDPDEPGATPDKTLVFTYEITTDTYDYYYDYTAEKDVILTISRPEGALVSFGNNSNDWAKDEKGNYVLSVPAGETVTLNFWSMNSGIVGCYNVYVMSA